MDSASKATEQLNKQMNLDKMEDLLEKLEDQKADAEERADFFIRARGTEDDEELMDELNELEALDAAKELEEMEIGAGHIKGKQVEQQQQEQVNAGSVQNEEDELKALEAMMS